MLLPKTEPLEMWAVRVRSGAREWIASDSISRTRSEAISAIVGHDRNPRARRRLWKYWKRRGCELIRVTVQPFPNDTKGS